MKEEVKGMEGKSMGKKIRRDGRKDVAREGKQEGGKKRKGRKVNVKEREQKGRN